MGKVYLETFSHVTEDPERVKQALTNLLPPEVREEALKLLSSEVTYGHYKNPIIIYRLNIAVKELAKRVAGYILSNLKEDDRESLLNTLGLRVDSKRNIYIRLDKQSAFLGEVRLSEGGDDIKAVLSFLPHVRGVDMIRKELKKLWESLTKS